MPTDKPLPSKTVLMDTWYALIELILCIESLKKIYYCPLKSNRLVDDAIGARPYQYIRDLNWSDVELNTEKTSKIKAYSKKYSHPQ